MSERTIREWIEAMDEAADDAAAVEDAELERLMLHWETDGGAIVKAKKVA